MNDKKHKIHAPLPRTGRKGQLAFPLGLLLATALGTQAHAMSLTIMDQSSHSPVSPHYRYIINEDNTGTTTQRNAEPGSGCSAADPGYPDSCNWVSIAGVKKGSQSPIVTQGDSSNATSLAGVTDLPPGKYLISVLADGYKLDGEHFTVPASRTLPAVTVQMMPNAALPTATIQAEIFEDNTPTNSAPDVPAEQGLADWQGTIVDYLGPVTTDVLGNPLCTEYAADGSVAVLGGSCLSKCYVVSGGVDIGTVAADATHRCPIDTASAGVMTPIAPNLDAAIPAGAVIEGKLKIPNLGTNRYALSATPPTGTNWVQTTTLEGNHDWDAWVMEGATGLDTEFTVGGEPFPAIFFGFVQPNNAAVGAGGNITGIVRQAKVYVPTIGGAPLAGTIWGGLGGAVLADPINKPWIALNDLNNGDKAVWVGQGNADGTFAIPSVPAGSYTVTFWDEDQNMILDFVSINTDGNAVNMGTLPLTGWWTTIEGFVFNDINRDGVKDATEPGIDNYAIAMKKRENSVMDRGATGVTTHPYPGPDKPGFKTGDSGYYQMVNAYPMTQWLVEEAYNDSFYTTGVTYQTDNQPSPTTVTGSGVDVNVLPIIGLSARLDWGKHAYDPGGTSPDCVTTAGVKTCPDPKNGGIVGTVTYDTTRNELDPRYAFTEIWQPGIPDLTVNLHAPVPCPVPAGATPCSTGGIKYALNTDGSYQKGPLINQYLTETWEQPTNLTDPSGCKARDVSKTEFTHGPNATEFVLPSNKAGARCLEGPLMGNQFGPNAADGEFGASVNGNYGFGDACLTSPLGATPAQITWGTFNPASLTDPNANACLTGTLQPLPGAKDYLVEVIIPTDSFGKPMYQVTKEEDINIANGDGFVPQVPPPACAGPLHTVHVVTSPADAHFDPANPSAGSGVYNPTFPDIGGSPYEGQQKPLCNMKLITVSNGKSIAPNFNLFTDVPLPGRFWGLAVDDLNFSSNIKSMTVGEKAGIPFAPVGIYDYANRLIYTTESDYNGLFDVLLPSTNRISCPTPSGVCSNLYRFVGNDPGAPGNLNPNYHPEFRTIAAEFEAFPGLMVPADLAPTQVGVSVQIPGGQTAQPVNCPVEPTRPQLFAVDKPNGGTGSSVTITGAGFGATKGAGRVALGATTLATTAWSDKSITATISGPVGPGQLNVFAANGLSTINGLTYHVTGNGYNPTVYEVGPGKSYGTIQVAIDVAEASGGNNLVVVYPGVPDLANPRNNPRGAYYENLIITTPLKLQGVGPGGVYTDGTPSVSGSIIDGGAFVGDSQLFTDWQAKIAALQVAPGWVGTQSIYEGADITVFARTTTQFCVPGVGNNANTCSNAVPSFRASIDGFDLRGGNQQGFPTNINVIGGGPTGLPPNATTQGGAIFANGYVHYMQITNNVVQNNGGSYGTIRFGTPNLIGVDSNEGTSQHVDNALIANNRIVSNAGTNLAGGIALFAGTDNYEVRNNDICGNFSAEYGGGITQYGRNLTGVGKIHDNRIYFNRSYDEGGGIMITGALPVNTLAIYGSANGAQGAGSVDIYNNLIQANQSNDDGGGIRFLMAASDCNANTAGLQPCPIKVYNNMIVNNVSTHEGGGVAIDDTPNVQFYNNTVMKNLTTATAVTSNGQPAPAGLSAAKNSTQLSNGTTGIAAVTPPLMFNNSFWDNRAGTKTGIAPYLVDGLGLPGSGIHVWDFDFADGSTPLMVSTFSVIGSDPGVKAPYDTVLSFQPWRNVLNGISAIMITQDLAPGLLGDYHLNAGATGINGGAGNKVGLFGTATAPTFDIDNQTRVAAPDIGADEFAAIAVTADLAITKTDGATSVAPGSVVTYTIVATNNGPNPVGSATVTDTMLAPLTNVTWTCAPVSGGNCGAATSGGGNINAIVSLPGAGSGVTFTVTGTVNASSGTLSNTASISGAGVTDLVPGNNSATDVDTIAVPLPVLSVLDNFNRANNLTSLGANWNQQTFFGLGGIGVITNQAQATAGGRAIWNVTNAGFGARQGAAYTFTNAQRNNAALILKAIGGALNTPTPTSYIRVQYTGTQVTVATTVNGAAANPTFTARGTFTASFASGDTFSAVAYADGTVNVYKTAAGASTAIGSVTIPGAGFWTGAGRIGIQLPLAGLIDNFAGGTVP
jgi:uncharacterized repeat protein (TIGR01451 family)